MANISKDEEESLKNIDFSHPEVLTSGQLRRLFEQRNISVKDCGFDKDKLLALFYHTLLPLPQREYKQNRRGKLMMQKRVQLLRKRKETSSLSPTEKQIEPVSKCLKLTDISSIKSTEVSSRLKPPPTAINTEKKTIKLNIKTCNGSLNAKSENSGVSHGSKIIKMINDTLKSNVKSTSPNGSDVKSLVKTERNMKEESPPKKKHKPITWP